MADVKNEAGKNVVQNRNNGQDKTVKPVVATDPEEEDIEMSDEPEKKNVVSSKGSSNAGQSSEGSSEAGQSSDGSSEAGQSSEGSSEAGQSSDGSSEAGQSSDGSSEAGQSSDGSSEAGQSSDARITKEKIGSAKTNLDFDEEDEAFLEIDDDDFGDDIFSDIEDSDFDSDIDDDFLSGMERDAKKKRTQKKASKKPVAKKDGKDDGSEETDSDVARNKRSASKDSPKHKEPFFPDSKTGYELTEKGDAKWNRSLVERMIKKMKPNASNKEALVSMIGSGGIDDYELYSVYAFANVFDNAKNELDKVSLKRLFKSVSPRNANELKNLFESIAFGIGLYELSPDIVMDLIEEAVKPTVKGFGNPFLQITTFSDSGAKTVQDYIEWSKAVDGNRKLSSSDWSSISDVTRDLAQTYSWDEICDMVSKADGLKSLKENVVKKGEGPKVTTKSVSDEETGEQVNVLSVSGAKKKKGKSGKSGGFGPTMESRFDVPKIGFVELINEEVTIEPSDDGDDELRSLLEMFFGSDADFMEGYFSSKSEKDVMRKILLAYSDDEKDLSTIRSLNWHDVILASGTTKIVEFFDEVFEQIAEDNGKGSKALDSDEISSLFGIFHDVFGNAKDAMKTYYASGTDGFSEFEDIAEGIIGNESLLKDIRKPEELSDVVSALIKRYTVKDAVRIVGEVEGIEEALDSEATDEIADS